MPTRRVNNKTRTDRREAKTTGGRLQLEPRARRLTCTRCRGLAAGRENLYPSSAFQPADLTMNMPAMYPVMDMERARFNMVECQIRTWDVLDPRILDLVARPPREDYVPAP